MNESRESPREMVTVSQARSDVLRACVSVDTEIAALADSIGRVLRSDVVADIDIPPFDNSAMDGFAVSIADLDNEPVVLSVVEEIPAGSWPQKTVGDGFCSRIMTGAPVPPGTDAVIPVEWTRPGANGGLVEFDRLPKIGQHIRRKGSDIRIGTTALRPPFLITPHAIGLLASLGYGEVSVSKKPTLSIIATGDELVSPDEKPELGQIRNSNGPTLAAMGVEAGARVVGQYVAPDNRSATTRIIEEALNAEIIVISGGVSVGSYDFVKDVLDDLGMSVRFWKVRQRPGKPLTFGTIGDKLVFGLPGNPVSSAVCFRSYVRPAIRSMLGLNPGPETLRARLEESIAKVPALHYFLPGIAQVSTDGNMIVSKSGAFGSHIFSSLAVANCLINLPEGPSEVEAGTLVDVEPLQPITPK